MFDTNTKIKPFCGEPAKMVLVSNPCYFFALPPQCYLSLTERLTVKDNGKVSFKSTKSSSPSAMKDGSPEGKYGEWASLSLIPFDARSLLKEVAEMFAKYSDHVMVTDVGLWELTLTNTDGEAFRYSGSLFPESFEGCTRISDYIRAKLGMGGLLCFDGGPQPKEYIYLSVRFGEHGKSYYYQTDDESIDVGDQVIVPVGDDGAERIVDVVNVRKYTEDNLPMPLNRVKSIIGKFEIPETVYCPVCEKDISPSDCSLIEMTVEGLCPPNECDDFVKPGLIKERSTVCLNCRYHSPDAYPARPADTSNTVLDQ